MQRIKRDMGMNLGQTRGVFKKSALALAMASAMMVSGGANAVAVTDFSGAVSITGADTVNAAGTITDADAITDTTTFTIDDGADATTTSLTITGAGTVTLGKITNGTSDNAGDTADLVIGNGTGDTIVVISGAITGLDQNGAPVADANLDILVTVGTGNDDSTLQINGNTDAATGVVLTGGAGTGITTLTIGDGTNAAVFAGTIDMSDTAATISVVNGPPAKAGGLNYG